MTRSVLVFLVVAALAAPAQAYHRQTPEVVAYTSSGDNPLPRLAAGRRFVVAIASSGRQIFMRTNLGAFQVTHDPTGTSQNPALSGRGRVLGFESSGDLVDNGNRTQQIFVRGLDGSITQLSHGAGVTQGVRRLEVDEPADRVERLVAFGRRQLR